MKHYVKKLIAGLLVLAMTMSLALGDATFAFADAQNSDYAACITLKEGVDAEVEASTSIYNGYKPDLGSKFVDAEGHSMVYYVSRSVYDSETETWGEPSEYQEIVIGFASSLAEYAVTEENPGVYKYSWKGYCKSEEKLSEETYTVILTVTDPEETTYDMTFYVSRDMAGANYNPVIKLYPTTGTDKDTGYDLFNEEDEIELEGGELDSSGQYRVYTASLRGGAYSYRAWGYDSETESYTNFLGGMSVSIPMLSNVTQSGYDELSVYIKEMNVASKTKYDEINYLDASQYTTEVVCPYYNCTATPGTSYVAGGVTYYPYMLIAQGNACLYNYYVYPAEDVAEEYDLMYGYGINATVAKGYTAGSWSPSVATRITSAITVPEGAEAEVFFQMNNFRDIEIESYDQQYNEDGTVTWYFYVPQLNANYTYRVSKEGYVTKAGYLSLGSEDSAVFSVELDRTDVTSHDFSGLNSTVSTRDEADIIMNVSDQNFKTISVDETFRLRAYRVWEIINTDAGNIMIEPDFNYEILSGADCISVEPVEDNRTNGKNNWLDITGVSEGTAVIAVTYNAIEVDGTTTHGGFFPAISPERTGIVVIHVGQKNSDITDLGVKNAYGNKWIWNYDTYYYVSPEESGTITITPEAVSGIASVEVAEVSTTDDLDSAIGEWKEVSLKDDSYNVPLVEGNNIIKVTSNDGAVAYQVVRAAQLEVNFSNNSNPGEDIMPGDKVQISFEGLYRTIPKISGIFNPVTLKVIGTGSDGTQYTGSFAQYQIADKATFEVKIPDDISFEEGSETTTYTISNGHINLEFMYSYADAWKFMYTLTDAGIGTNFNAVSTTGNHTTISDINIPVSRKVTYDVSFNVIDELGNKVEDYDLTVTDPDGNEVSDFSALGYGTYSYHIEKLGYVVKDSTFKLGSATTAEEGKTIVDIVLQSTDENAWDGVSMSEPEQDADGIYLIGTGAELAWFANAVNNSAVKTTSTLNAKLTADIDLAGYQWPQIGYYTSTSAYVYYGGIFDGNGYSINNFKNTKQTETMTAFYDGFFAYTSGAVIKDVTINGDVTVGSSKSVASAYTGGIAGYALNTTFENVISDINVKVNRVSGNYQYTGGVCGYAKGTTSFTNVQNHGDVTGYYYVGGITGYTESSMNNVQNTGTVSGYWYAGGIVGKFTSSGSITNALNQGDVSATSYAAGITGMMGTANGSISKVINEGNITVQNGYAAGIAGVSAVAINVADCLNLGDITAGATGYVGTIAGNVSATTAESSFANCISVGQITVKANSYVGNLVGNIKMGTIDSCSMLSQVANVTGSDSDTVKITGCYTGNTENEVLYAYATGKAITDYKESAQEHLNELLSTYVSDLKDDSRSVEERLAVLDEIKNVDFDKYILENEIVNVTVSAQSENTFIASPKVISVNGYTAESYGYTDAVADGVSVLDVLVAEHVQIYGDAFTESAESEYLEVSSSTYGTFVSKAFEKDGSTFMFSVNGACPHNDVLEYGYYTGYTVDQAAVLDGDSVDFYFCQDAYWNDNIAWFEADGTTAYTGKPYTLKVLGYNYAWYGSCEESVIEENTSGIEGAQLAVVNQDTGVITPLEGSITDENGTGTIVFETPGTYMLTAYVTDENATPIFMPVMTVTVELAQPTEVIGATIQSIKDNMAVFTWSQDDEQKMLGQTYSVYVDDVLYGRFPGVTNVYYAFEEEGTHTIKITTSLNGFETEGVELEVLIKNPTTEEPTTTSEESATSEEITTTEETTTPEETTALEETTKPEETTTVEAATTSKAFIPSSSKTNTVTKGKISISWKKVKGVDGYDIFARQCGKKFTKKNIVKSVKSSKTSATISKIGGKKLKANKTYKIRVCAYKLVNGKKQYVASTLTYHVVAANNKKYTNTKKIKLSFKKVTLKVNETKKIQATAVKADKKKKNLSKKHGNLLRYASSDKTVATVNKKGKITAKGKGTCYIYVTALNGVQKKVKVTVG